MATQPTRTHGVDSARKVLQILLMFNEDSPVLAIDDIVARLESSVSSSYRYLSLLKEMNLLEERARGTYVLSPRVIGMARAAETSVNLLEASRPILADLSAQTGETALVMKRLAWSAVCVERVQPDTAIRLSFAPGTVMPLHRGASAKVLLAAVDPGRVRTYLDQLSSPLTADERSGLEAELDDIRRRGVGESAAEVDAGIWAVAAPVTVAGTVVAAVTVAAPEFRVDEQKRERIRGLVVTAATDVAARLLLSPL